MASESLSVGLIALPRYLICEVSCIGGVPMEGMKSTWLAENNLIFLRASSCLVIQNVKAQYKPFRTRGD